jgi:hypothetical protein
LRQVWFARQAGRQRCGTGTLLMFDFTHYPHGLRRGRRSRAPVNEQILRNSSVTTDVWGRWISVDYGRHGAVSAKLRDKEREVSVPGFAARCMLRHTHFRGPEDNGLCNIV